MAALWSHAGTFKQIAPQPSSRVASPNLKSRNVPSGTLLTCCQVRVVVDKEASLSP